MKKFLKVFLLCMAVLTVLTVAVSASDYTLYVDGVNNHTLDLDAPDGKTYTWMTPDGEYISVNSATGLVTAIKAKQGTATIYAMEAGNVVETHNIIVKNRDLTSIKVTNVPAKTTYYSGQIFNPAGLKVTAVYDNLDEVELASNKYTTSPAGALKVGDTVITITYVENGVTTTATQAIEVREVLPVEVTIAIPTKDQLKEEDSFPAIVVTVKNNDNSTTIAQDEYVVKLNGEVIDPASKKMVLADNGAKVKVVYKGVESTNEVTLTVKEKWNPTVEYSGTLSKKTYEVGDKLDWTGYQIVIKNNGEVVKTYTADMLNSLSAFAKSFTSEDVGTNKDFTFDVAPDSSKPTQKVEITVKLTVKEKRIEVVLDGSPKKNYKEGDAFDWTGVHAITLKKNGTNVISFTSNEIKEISSLKYTFDRDDIGTTKRQFTITYNGEAYTFEITGLAITAKPSYVPDAKIVGSFTKTTYKVGDTLSWAGVSALILKDKNSTEVDKTYTAAELLALPASSPLSYKFKSSDVGKNTITFEYESEAGYTYEIKVEGLTIQDTLGALNPAKLTALVLDRASYPVGYTFNISDIYYVQYALTQYATNSLVAYESDLVCHTDFMSLEVLTAAGARKSDSRQAYRNVIEAADVYTNNGERVVNVRFYMKDIYTYVDTRIPVREASVIVTYQGSTIGTYDTIDDAVIAVNALSTTEYPVTGSAVVITLNKDQKITTQVKIQVNRYIEIDLNGFQLTFYDNTVNSSMGQRYLSITNTSTTEGKFIYYGYSTTLKLKKGESFTFYNNYNTADQLPGFYTVELAYDSTGKVTSTPSATSKKVAVGHGNDISLTITPNTDYFVSELKVDNTKYTKSNNEYTEKANNVVAFVYRVVDDCDISIKFAKEVKVDDPTDISDWENPFTDVSSYATYYEAVAFVNKNGIFQGTSTTKFSPSSTMTRAMFVTVLGRLAGIDASTAQRLYGTTSKFTDVSKSDPRYDYYSYAVPYIAWATQNGLIEGHGGAEKGTFGPEDPITHQQMYVIMQRYANSIAKQSLTSTVSVNLPYTDKAQIAEWAEYAVKVAYVNDYIITTSTNRISPTTNATRAELAMLIEKFAKNVLEWGVAE